MKLKKNTRLRVSRKLPALCLTASIAALCPLTLPGAPNSDSAPPSPSVDSGAPSQPENSRYGLFDWLDHRSSYGAGVFPEPFLVDDSDLEVNEFRLDWLHTCGDSQRTDTATVEVEKGFGELTLELEAPFERDRTVGQDPNTTTEGFGNIDLGARYPIYQYVSDAGLVDSTFGASLEAGIPTQSRVSKNAEFVPAIFDDLRVGEHFTLQAITGYSTLFGGGDDGGLQTYEYGLVFGYTIPHKQLPLPGVEQLIPVLELSGATQLNHDNPGHDALLANLAFRLNLKAIGRIQPRLGLGFVFPVDDGAYQDTHYGVYTSLVFEY